MIKLERSNAALIFLSLVVIASGCSHTGENTGPSSSITAVQVQNFSAIPSTVYESQSPTLRLSLKNTGTVEAEEVEAELFNVPFGDSENREWEAEDLTFNFQTLRSAEPDAGLPATPKEKTMTLTPPNLSEGETISYDFMARISFKYETRADTEIQLMSQSQFQDSGASKSRPVVENTDGPIQMEVKTRTPIVLYGGDRTSNLCLIVKNEGEGTPYEPDNPGNENTMNVDIRKSGDLSFEAVDGESGKVELVNGRGIKCYQMDISFDAESDIQRTIPVTFVATYGYRKDTQTTVTVKGRGEGSTSEDDGDSEDGEETGYTWSGDKSTAWDTAKEETGSDSATENCIWLRDNGYDEIFNEKCEEA